MAGETPVVAERLSTSSWPSSYTVLSPVSPLLMQERDFKEAIRQFPSKAAMLFYLYSKSHTDFRYFRKMVVIFSSPPFYTRHVRLPTPSDALSSSFKENPRFYPFFKDALGAIDGTQIPVQPPPDERAAYLNKNGVFSQNCLVANGFNLKFLYVLTGWEGSANDARVWRAARDADLHIPKGKYYLGDAGLPLGGDLLVPYKTTRYHLSEKDKSRQRLVL